MSTIGDAAAALRMAAATVVGLRAYEGTPDDPGAVLDPPAVVVGPPELAWREVSRDSIDATFTVYLVMPADDRAIERLWDSILDLRVALETVASATVVSAVPEPFLATGLELPAYAIEVRYAIQAQAQ